MHEQTWFRRVWRDERGSNVAQAAGVAMAAAILIAAILLGARGLSPAVDHAFQCVVAALGGSGTCSSGAAATTGGPGGAPATDQPSANKDDCNWLCQIVGVPKGIGEGAWDMAKGVWTLGSDAFKAATGDQATRDKYARLWESLNEDPGGTLLAIGKAFIAPTVDAWSSGHYGEAIGRGGFDIGSLFVGPKGLDKLGKLGRAGEVVGDIGRVGEVAGDAGRVGRVGEIASDAGRVGDAAGDAGRVGEALDDIRRATSRVPCRTGLSKAPGLAAPLAGCLERAERMLEGAPGYNVSPEGWFSKYPALGRDRSFITDKRAISDILGEFEGKGGSITITQDQAKALEQALGLEDGSLIDGFRISKVENVAGRSPGSPLAGNDKFLGPGKGLPGGGPELTIDPISTNSPDIPQITIHIEGK